jgi:predicted Zn-ribbon and HTH transcriptional regulator
MSKKFICKKCDFEVTIFTDTKIVDPPRKCPKCKAKFIKEKQDETMEVSE